MEDTLRGGKAQGKFCHYPVLILVVMEDTLRAVREGLTFEDTATVLILVVMEDTLRVVGNLSDNFDL